MILTFNELGLDPCPPAYTRAWIINEACDYIMRHYFPRTAEEDAMPNPRGAFVAWGAKVVVIRTASPVIW